MYERSAIVLERYFDNVLGYSSENNLKVNFENYCSLVEKLDKFQQCYEQEQIAVQEFEDVTDRLKAIQKNQEKLYKKSAKLEFNRNMLFNNIEDKVDNIEHCMIKIENDVDKNKEAFKTLRVEFILTLDEYNNKKSVLSKAKRAKREAEKTYREILQISRENIENINEFILELARNFNGAEIREKLFKLMIDNGKNEKIPFDEATINLATDLGINVAQREVQCYVEAYDATNKLFNEIEKNDIKIEKFKKKLRDINAKLNFLYAEKEYLVQFLDYERITSINGKRNHKKLMALACENFALDINQINNLYELILKEVANKSTKKIYKELYNKSYLLEINHEEATLKKEKNKVNLSVATVLGSNFWRIEGIKNIYTVFYKEVSEVFGRDLDEFDLPYEDGSSIKFEEEIEDLAEKIEVQQRELDIKLKNFKIPEEISEDELPKLLSEEDVIEEKPLVSEKVEKYEAKKIEEIELLEEIAEIEELPEIKEVAEIKVEKISKESKHEENKNTVNKVVEKAEKSTLKSKASKTYLEEDIPYEEDEQEYEMEEEESLFGNIKNVRNTRRTNLDLEILDKLEEKNKSKKKGILKTLIKTNSKKGKRVAN